MSEEKTEKYAGGEQSEAAVQDKIESDNFDAPGYEEIVTMKPEEIKDEFDRMVEIIEKLRGESSKFQEKFKRSQADFANYRRRVKEDKKGLAVKYKCEVIDALLPVLDNFERALESSDRDDEFSRGVEMIYRQFKDSLKKEGVEEIEAEGEEFDHEYHEAVEQVEAGESEEGTVVEEVQTGYRLDDRVIRPALVKVAR